MFALRASYSSAIAATRRCPSLVAHISRQPPTASARSDNAKNASTNLLSYLDDPSTGSGPTPFEMVEPAVIDEPPSAPEGSFPRKSRNPYIEASSSGATMPEYKLHCHATQNNTIVTFTKPDGSTIAWFSGGSTPTKSRFRGANRKSFEAGYQCAKAIFQKIEEWNTQKESFKLEILFKGFGEGRTAMRTALLADEGINIRPLVSRLTDRTPIKIGGTRAKKTRRC